MTWASTEEREINDYLNGLEKVTTLKVEGVIFRDDSDEPFEVSVEVPKYFNQHDIYEAVATELNVKVRDLEISNYE